MRGRKYGLFLNLASGGIVSNIEQADLLCLPSMEMSACPG
jgi:hypothetical protein